MEGHLTHGNTTHFHVTGAAIRRASQVFKSANAQAQHVQSKLRVATKDTTSIKHIYLDESRFLRLFPPGELVLEHRSKGAISAHWVLESGILFSEENLLRNSIAGICLPRRCSREVWTLTTVLQIHC